MPKHKQEFVADWMQDARDLAKAERELEIEHWVYISLERRLPDGTRETLYHYNLPRDMLERWLWVIGWRSARLQCRFPRSHIMTCHHYYDKRTGLKTGFDSCLSKLAAAKAQITKAKRSEQEYIAHQSRKYPMFYDPASDPDLIKFKTKLAQKEENVQVLTTNIQAAIEKHNRESRLTMY